MTGKSHLLIGLCTGLIIAQGQSPAAATAITGLAMLGSLAPDIDHPNSFISRALFPVRLIFCLLPHRGPTHSLLAVLLLGLCAVLLGAKTGIEPLIFHAFVLGYVSHIAADMMTIDGLRVWYPVDRQYWLMPPGFRIRTSSPVESLFVLILLVFIVWRLSILTNLLTRLLQLVYTVYR